jgi:CRP/FNR family transcriptional regulator, cyclic AMP receptor protein
VTQQGENRRPGNLGEPSGARTPWRFSSQHLALLRAAGRVGIWRRGAVLLREAETSDGAMLIERGLVKITTESYHGYTTVLALRGPGELIGELSTIDGQARSASAVAMTAVQAIVISVERFHRLLENNGEFTLAVLCLVVSRLRDSDRTRAEFGAQSASERVARVLLDLAQRHGLPVRGSDTSRVVAVTQQELAGVAGTSRESVVRALRELGRTGLIATSRGKLTIPDVGRLERSLRT